MDATDVRAVAEQCAQFLGAAITADWSTPIPDMGWTVAQAVAHAAEVPLWYAFDLAAGGPSSVTANGKVGPATDDCMVGTCESLDPVPVFWNLYHVSARMGIQRMASFRSTLRL
jgi:hypothetical protein